MNATNTHEQVTLGFSGHRPTNLGGYAKYEEYLPSLVALAKGCIERFGRNENEDPNTANQDADRTVTNASANVQVITGMALGWDTAVALAAIEMELPLIAALPCYGYEQSWPKREDKDRYHFILSNCHTIWIGSVGGYSYDGLVNRNEVIVNNSNKVIFLWDKKPKGGTYNCWNYAQEVNRECKNVWGSWSKKMGELGLEATPANTSTRSDRSTPKLKQ